MGIIICEFHERKFVVQMSEKLHKSFKNGKKENIVKLVCDVNSLDSIFIHYFSDSDSIVELFYDDMNLTEFENNFIQISGDPGCCEQCFDNYINENNIEVIEKLIKVSEQ